MSEHLKISNLKTAISRLPNPKAYPPEVVTVAVDKFKYTFVKIKNEWYFKF